MIVSAPKEFSFQQCLYFLNRSPHELLHTASGEHVEKALRLNGQTILFSVKENRKGGLQVQVLNGRINEKTKRLLREYIEEWFDLKTDLRPFYKLAKKDLLLKNHVKKYFGYRTVSMPDLFEALSWAIIGQQIHLNFAYLLKQRFIRQFGECVTFNNKNYFLFPTPEIVSKVEPAQLLSMQFSRQKADYLIGLAKSFAAGIISKEKFASYSFEDARQELIKLKGIGNWTANYVLMKTFHFPNAFPIEDAGLHQAIRKHLKLERKPALDEVSQLFKKYEGFEAYATLYFWRSLGED